MTALSMPNPASSAEPAPAPRRWVARVFERLGGQLGAKVADLYANQNPEAVQEEWAAGMAGLHPEEIARGIAACRERVFAPTLGEFLNLCRPGLNPEWAWHEAADCLRQRDAGQRGDWSHPAIWRTACTMSPEVRGGDYQRNRTRWIYTLRREFAAGWGDGVPPPAMRVTHNAAVRGPGAKEREALASLRNLHVKSAAASAAGITEE